MRGLALPLWCAHVGMSPALIGITLSARSIVPLLFSIQGGKLMDELGPRRALAAFSLVNIVLLPLYPFARSAGTLIGLELLTGTASAFSWMGAQTALARVARGDTGRAGQFAFSTSLGNVGGPILVGAAWQAFGPAAAFDVIAAWAVCLLIAVMVLPGTELSPLDNTARWRLRRLLPTLSIYAGALRMLRHRGVALVIFVTFVRIALYTVQMSFYAIALRYVGQSEAHIGLLIGASQMSSGVATLIANRVGQTLRSPTLAMFAGVATGIVAISLTPWLSGFAALLAAALVYGGGTGIAFPILLATLSAHTTPEQQGTSVGLRATANRLAGLIVPVLLGTTIGLIGIGNAFLAAGTALFVILILGGLIFARSAR